MKRTLFVSILLIISTGFFGWTYKNLLFEKLLSKQLNNMPVRLYSLDFSKNCMTLKDLFIGNAPQSRTNISFGVEEINIDTSLKEITKNPLVIDSISFKDTLIAVEYFNESGTKNNWQLLLSDTSPKWKIKKNYLIKKVTVENIVIQVTDHNGKVVKYPPINKMEFFNINQELGFPINKIDKMIFNTIVRAVFSRLGLDNLLDDTKSDQVIAPHISSNSKKNSGN